jgi:DNA-directed RNA polymerase specialized sigma24 family protein
MALTHDDYDWASEIVKRAAVAVARRWPGIDREDIEQEIWVFLLPKFDGLLKDDDYLFTAASRAGNEYAAGERDHYTRQTAQWIYTPNEVRALFKEAFFDPACWEEAPQKEKANRLFAGGVVVALWDMQEAFNGLPEQYQEAITRCYRDRPGVRQDEATSKRLRRAIDRATELLNSHVVQRERVDLDWIS